MASTHSWENPAPASSLAHSWEATDYRVPTGDTSDEDEVDEQRVASTEFMDVLLSMYLESAISARILCTLCWWAAKAGMPGQLLRDCACNPDSDSGNFQKRLDSKLGFGGEKAKAYKLQVPCCKTALSRDTMMLPLRPPHELVEEDMASHPHVEEDLQERLAAGEMPPCYTDNPIVKASLTSVIPYAIFMDGLPYSLVDTVLGIWKLNWLTGARSLVGLVREKYCASVAARAGAPTTSSYPGCAGVLGSWLPAPGHEPGTMAHLLARRSGFAWSKAIRDPPTSP